ncbi:MAG: hypothetical protein KIH64_010735 [Mycobacterium sp.]|nr:hypothetical protein [Mycobacterium sp.]
MAASQFVGRVGGLAVALGVGVAVFSGGSGVASADRSGHDAGSTKDSSSQNGPTRTHRGSAAATPRGQRNSAPVVSAESDSAPTPAAAVASPRARVAAPAAAESAPEVEATPVDDAVEIAVDAVEIATATEGPVAEPIEVKITTDPVVEDIVGPVEIAEPMPSTPDGEMVAFLSNTADASDGAGSDPAVPVDSPLLAAFMALAARRDGTAQASVTSSAVTASGLTVAPTVYYYDGILQGNLNAVSAGGNTLTYTFVGSSAGGKLDIGNVPSPLPGSGAQSYPLLPYATWIDPAAPDPLAQPSGSQTWSVRVSESTKFDQFLVKIPLVGLIAQPIIDLLQKTPLLSTLLAPIIGASTVAEITVDFGQPIQGYSAGNPVAYTYMMDSWDGTNISTNFFPAVANSLLPGNYGATIFNGPGLGSPGATDPYGTNQAAGSAPGLAILRGALQAQSGFNVVTWDPRGEYDSGGILQLDNPFFEGRDVSSLIDWALANTPAIQVQGSPLIGMVGGSYGGGIQMTTVDPRLKAVIPAIAWNSLNESLYPDQIFKTAWANALALTLLGSGASSLSRVNSQIPLALLTGNLFGTITPTGQAVLTSSGPTSLLTKLSIPTMYVQGIVDALFPLAEAVENAQTQLEENPYFSGANANQVKMVWFCGGHGVCFDFTSQQQAAQATTIFTQNMAWLNTYVKGAPLPIDQIVPTFQWWDQAANHYASALMPFANGFVTGSVEGTNADGGRLAILPLAIGGSGPNKTNSCDVADSCEFPLSQVFATEARNSIDVPITVAAAGTQIVGRPQVSFTYSGFGTAKAVYGQIVDNATGRVLGNIATQIPVTLDGKTHTVELADLNGIAYTATTPNSSLTLQIVGGATLFKTGKFGSIKISDVVVDLPTTNSGTIV